VARSTSHVTHAWMAWAVAALLAGADMASAAEAARFEARRYRGAHGLVQYRLFVPRVDGPRRPILVLWLHGPDGRGTDNLRQIGGQEAPVLGGLTSESFQRESPTLVVVPQCPPGRTWTAADGSPSEELQAALDLVEMLLETAAYKIEDRRIYVGGREMGEDGARALLAQRPYLVARMQPPAR